MNVIVLLLAVSLGLVGLLYGARAVWRKSYGVPLKLLLIAAMLALAWCAMWAALVVAYYAGGGH